MSYIRTVIVGKTLRFRRWYNFLGGSIYFMRLCQPARTKAADGRRSTGTTRRCHGRIFATSVRPTRHPTILYLSTVQKSYHARGFSAKRAFFAVCIRSPQYITIVHNIVIILYVYKNSKIILCVLTKHHPATTTLRPARDDGDGGVSVFVRGPR